MRHLKIVEYEVVKVQDVDDYLKIGWQPYKSPYCTPIGDSRQAMVKYEEKSKRILKDFKILFSDELGDDGESLRLKILEHIKHGYQLHGTIIIDIDGRALKYAQAMVLYE